MPAALEAPPLSREMNIQLNRARMVAAVGKASFAQRTDELFMRRQDVNPSQSLIEEVRAFAGMIIHAKQLQPPEGSMFGVWSTSAPTVKTNIKAGDVWLPSPIPTSMRTDDRIYPDGFTEAAFGRPKAITASFIGNDLETESSVGSVFAYSPDGSNRYDISSRVFQVCLIPEPSSSTIYISNGNGLTAARFE